MTQEGGREGWKSVMCTVGLGNPGDWRGLPDMGLLWLRDAWGHWGYSSETRVVSWTPTWLTCLRHSEAGVMLPSLGDYF